MQCHYATDALFQFSQIGGVVSGGMSGDGKLLTKLYSDSKCNKEQKRCNWTKWKLIDAI